MECDDAPIFEKVSGGANSMKDLSIIGPCYNSENRNAIKWQVQGPAELWQEVAGMEKKPMDHEAIFSSTLMVKWKKMLCRATVLAKQDAIYVSLVKYIAI